MNIGAHLMPHRVDWYRAPKNKDSSNAQVRGTPTLEQAAIPAFVQPASASEVFFYQQRSQEATHTIYTNSTAYAFLRDDELHFGSRKFYILGVRNVCELGVGYALDCTEYSGPDRRVA